CMGIDNEPIKTVYSSIGLSIIETASAFSAVESSYLVAQEGDAVLLSPACPSFDLFESYEDRGVQFKNAVNEL
ncbi:MAG: UDP-N-acetylmuramoyl-L-alanine--D-glutamate ligase, partial [Bacteroidales bacterium]